MAFYTNYVDSITDGVLINSGQERQVCLREVLDAIVSATSAQTGAWKEVTGSSPTPTGIQSFATSIASSVTNANSAPANGDQVTLYQGNDPKISSDNVARLIRLEIHSSANQTDWMHTRIMDPYTRNDLWVQNPNINDGDLFTLTTNFSSSSSTGVLNNDHRLFVFMDDNWLIIALYDVILGETQGVMGFLFPDTVSGITRETLAFHWGFNAPPASGAVQNNVEMWSAAGAATPGGAQVVMSHIAGIDTILPANETPAFAFGRLEAYHTTTYFAHIQQIPRVRVVRADVISNDFQEFTADSETWLVLVKMDGMALCIDVTS